MTSPYLTNPPLTSREKRMLAALKNLHHACQHMIGSFDADDIAAFEAASTVITEVEGRTPAAEVAR